MSFELDYECWLSLPISMIDLEPVQKKTVWLVMKVDIKLFEVLFKELELFPLEKK